MKELEASRANGSLREQEYAQQYEQMQEMLQKREAEWSETAAGLQKAEQERIRIAAEMTKALEIFDFYGIKCVKLS